MTYPAGAWIRARRDALTAAEQASPLARRPYTLRTRPVHVAKRRRLPHAGSRVGRAQRPTVPLRIYAKCVVGQDELAKRRISEERCGRLAPSAARASRF